MSGADDEKTTDAAAHAARAARPRSPGRPGDPARRGRASVAGCGAGRGGIRTARDASRRLRALAHRAGRGDTDRDRARPRRTPDVGSGRTVAAARGMSAWALGFAIVALVVAMFVGWGFPIGLVAIITAIIALRRPLESRTAAVWALVLGAVSLLYSAGWLVFATTRTDLLAVFG